MSTVLKRGATVAFVTKYGDKATGVYVGPSTIPGADGPVHGHLVMSGDCFGPDHNPGLGLVQCFMETPPEVTTPVGGYDKI